MEKDGKGNSPSHPTYYWHKYCLEKVQKVIDILPVPYIININIK